MDKFWGRRFFKKKRLAVTTSPQCRIVTGSHDSQRTRRSHRECHQRQWTTRMMREKNMEVLRFAGVQRLPAQQQCCKLRMRSGLVYGAPSFLFSGPRFAPGFPTLLKGSAARASQLFRSPVGAKQKAPASCTSEKFRCTVRPPEEQSLSQGNPM